jgi:hypothetical protein
MFMELNSIYSGWSDSALKLFENADDEWVHSESKKVITGLFLASVGVLWMGYVDKLLLNAFLFDLVVWTGLVTLAFRNGLLTLRDCNQEFGHLSLGPRTDSTGGEST